MSIPTNIAEGCGRNTDAEFARFLQISMGSASETEYELLLCLNLGFLEQAEDSELEGITQEVKRMLAALLKTLYANRRMPKAASHKLIAES